VLTPFAVIVAAPGVSVENVALTGFASVTVMLRMVRAGRRLVIAAKARTMNAITFPIRV
jgi:hypothetical protein